MGKKRCGALALCCALLMSVAVLYAWSVFVIPLEETYGWTRTETSGVFTLSMCAYCAGSLFSGFLSPRWPVQRLLWCTAALMAAGFAAAGRWPTLAGVSLGYGVLCGCGVGMAYNALLGYSAKWFPDWPGLCSGILLTCYGFATFPMAAVANGLLGSLGWNKTLLAFGVFEGLILVMGGLTLYRLPAPAPAGPEAFREHGEELSPGRMLRTGRFYGVFLWLMVLTASGLAAIGSAAQMALALGARIETAALLSGVITAFGCLGRLGFGRLFDDAGRQSSVLGDSLLMVAAVTVMALAFRLNSLPLLLAGLALLGVSYGGMSSLCAALVRSLFGARYYTQNLSIMALQMVPASLLGPLLGSVVYASWGGYTALCLGLLALDSAGTVLIACCTGGGKRSA